MSRELDLDASHRHYSVRAVLLLLALTTLTRAAFFLPGVINWDESTFTLVAQEILDGRLPYVQVWDLKPPLTFAFLAAAIAVFGHDVVAIRLAGLLCVFVASVQVSMLGALIGGNKVAIVAAPLFIVAISAIDSGQATMSEHIALPFILGATLLSSGAVKPSRMAGAGLLLGIATLVRLNLGYLAVGFGVWALVSVWPKGYRAVLTHMLAYCASGLGVLLVTAAPYIWQKQIPIFVYSVFQVQWTYSQAGLGPVVVATSLARAALGFYARPGVFNTGMWIGLSVWTAAVAGIIKLGYDMYAGTAVNARAVGALAVAATCVALSIAMSGSPSPHYLIQLLPFACVLAAYAYMEVFRGWLRLTACSLLGAAALFMLIPAERASLDTLKQLHSHRINRGPAFEIAAFLSPRCDNSCSIYMLNDHLVYWLLNKQPLSSILAHPSSIVRPHLLRREIGTAETPEAEMTRIMNKSPTYIVRQADVWYLRNQPAGMILDSALARNYALVTTIEGRRIYQFSHQ